MKVVVVSRSGREIIKGGVDLPDEATVADLQQAIYKYNRKWQPVRQRLTLAPAAPSSSGSSSSSSGAKPTVLDSRKRLSDYSSSLAGGDSTLTVVFKDLGPQIGYSTVFFWEYFGPLAIYPLFYFFPRTLYPQSTLDAAGATPPAAAAAAAAATAAEAAGTVRALALAFWSAHYAKRIFETFFVHRFSHGTMPLFNLFRNCAYYWLFAAYVSYFVNHPLYTPVSLTQAYVGFGIGVAAEVGNFICHIILRNLRPPSAAAKGGGDAGSSYVIPRGFLFDYITCPNYTCKIVAWLGFNIATQTVAGYLFMAAGAYQMTMWALQKHKRLRRLFDGKEGREKYPRRWVVFPPLL